MSIIIMTALSKNPEMLERFRKEPLEAIDELCEIIGSDTPRRMTVGEVQLLRKASKEEFEVLFSIAERMGNEGVNKFRM